ncbi:MAG: hypothetical protein IPK19_29080 [Chloroflexi bacterium]|nr:hypothetical protein [Chloroflexota bacterium]
MNSMTSAPPRLKLPPQTTPLHRQGARSAGSHPTAGRPGLPPADARQPRRHRQDRSGAGSRSGAGRSTADGATFVSLAPVSAADYLVSTIARALGFEFYEQEDITRQLFDHLSGLNLLLVMDNFEHLLDGAGLLSEITAHAPGIRISATPRERLVLTSETV